MLAVDTHAHIFETGLELAPVRRYAPTYNATAEDYLAVLDKHDVARGVLVQPSFLGTNNSYMIAALKRYPARFRGIAVVDPGIDFASLEAMDAVGVVGVRLNLGGLPVPHLWDKAWQGLFAHLRRLDWQVEIIRESADLPFLIDPLLDAGLTVVVDHFGRAGAAGTDDHGFQHLLRSARSRRVWVKLSGIYRNWPEIGDLSQAKACTARLLDAFGPERLLWGSDWPHTQNESKIQFALTQHQFETCVPNAADRKIILQDAPARLFRFNSTIGG